MKKKKKTEKEIEKGIVGKEMCKRERKKSAGRCKFCEKRGKICEEKQLRKRRKKKKKKKKKRGRERERKER